MVGVFMYWWWVSLGVIHGWCIRVLVVGIVFLRIWCQPDMTDSSVLQLLIRLIHYYWFDNEAAPANGGPGM